MANLHCYLFLTPVVNVGARANGARHLPLQRCLSKGIYTTTGRSDGCAPCGVCVWDRVPDLLDSDGDAMFTHLHDGDAASSEVGIECSGAIVCGSGELCA